MRSVASGALALTAGGQEARLRPGPLVGSRGNAPVGVEGAKPPEALGYLAP